MCNQYMCISSIFGGYVIPNEDVFLYQNFNAAYNWLKWEQKYTHQAFIKRIKQRFP